MAFIEARIFSESLGMATSFMAVIPERSTKGLIGMSGEVSQTKHKCLYLLHGLSDDETIWMRRTSIERYATKYGIAVIMPRADRSFYTDMKYGPKYFTYITEELPFKVADLFPSVSRERCDTVIGGLSMGGYGAIKAALRCPEKYSAVIALSSVADIVGRAEYFKPTLVPIFGEAVAIPESEDLFALSEKLPADIRPKIFMAVGRSDALCPDNERLYALLSSLGYDVSLTVGEGIHSWDFWDEHIRGGLDAVFGA